MAIEKMYMVDMVGSINQFDRVSKLVVMMNNFEPVDVLQQINSTNFTLSTNEDNMDALLNVCYIRPYTAHKDYSKITKQIAELSKEKSKYVKSNGYNKQVIWDDGEIFKSIEDLYEKYSGINEELIEKKNQREEYERMAQGLDFLSEVDVKMEELNGLSNFTWGMYKISDDNREKLKRNYENIPSTVVTLCKFKDYKIIMTFTPNMLLNEAQKIFQSANCEPIAMAKEFTGTPKEASESLREKKIEIEKLIEELERNLKKFFEDNNSKIEILDLSLELDMRANDIKNTAATTNEFFYLSGWVPEGYLKEFKKNSY